LSSAKELVINITGGGDLTLIDISNTTQELWDPELTCKAEFYFGVMEDSDYNGKFKIELIGR